MNNNTYIRRIYKVRFFLAHLVRWDIKYKFRGSVLGLIWSILQPLLLTAIIASVFSFIFNQEIKEYAPYILSGVLVWDVISSAVITSGSSFMRAETYIRQFCHPMIIYPLRSSMVMIINFLLASTSLILWVLVVYPENVIIGILSLPLTAIIYFTIAFSISVFAAHLNVRFRDYPYIMALAMQLLWYLSPVFFKEEMFLANELLHATFLVNPITHALLLVREPFLNGCFAGLVSYFYIIALSCLLFTIAWSVNQKAEKNVIYYL